MTGLLKVPKKPKPKKVPQSGLLHLSLYNMSCSKLANFGSMLDKQGSTNTNANINANTNTNTNRPRVDNQVRNCSYISNE